MASASDTLLVVDDNDISRHALARLLRQKGYEVILGDGGRDALRLAQAHPVDLVVLDIMMQDLGGLEVLEALRQTWPATDLPVIMATARDQSEDIVRALELGANDYVTKPLDLPVLLARIQTQLSLKKAVMQIRRLEHSLAQRNEELQSANVKLQAANTLMKQDLEAAARIQEAFLPPERPQLPSVCASWLFKPCAELAGDTLNVFPLDERYVGLYVLDVSGHGVAAALLAVTLSHVLSSRPGADSILSRPRQGTSGWQPIPPAEVAQRLNRRFPMDLQREQYFTIVYGVLDLETGELRYISAGHPGPVYLPADRAAVLLEATGLPIGIGQAEYNEHQLQLQPGDRLYLYSDGLVEAMNSDRDLFGKERLREAVEGFRSKPLSGSLSGLWDTVVRWNGSPSLRDDVSILGIEFVGPAAQWRHDCEQRQPVPV